MFENFEGMKKCINLIKKNQKNPISFFPILALLDTLRQFYNSDRFSFYLVEGHLFENIANIHHAISMEDFSKANPKILKRFFKAILVQNLL